MQKWFNNLNLLWTVVVSVFLNISGISLIVFRLNNHIPIGVGVGLFLIVESIILIYKKYFSTKSND